MQPAAPGGPRNRALGGDVDRPTCSACGSTRPSRIVRAHAAEPLVANRRDSRRVAVGVAASRSAVGFGLHAALGVPTDLSARRWRLLYYPAQVAPPAKGRGRNTIAIVGLAGRQRALIAARRCALLVGATTRQGPAAERVSLAPMLSQQTAGLGPVQECCREAFRRGASLRCFALGAGLLQPADFIITWLAVAEGPLCPVGQTATT